MRVSSLTDVNLQKLISRVSTIENKKVKTLVKMKGIEANYQKSMN